MSIEQQNSEQPRCVWCSALGELQAGVYCWACSSRCADTARDAAVELKRWQDETARIATERNDALDHLEAMRIHLNELKAEIVTLEAAPAARRRVRPSKISAGGGGLDALADELEPGQSVIIGRPNAEQLAALAAIEQGGAWALTVLGATENDVRLFCGDDRSKLIAEAREFLRQKNAIKEEPRA